LAANSVSVAEESLHGRQVHAGFDQVRGKRVPQSVNTAFTGNAGGVTSGAVNTLRCARIDRRAARTVGKQPSTRPLIAPVAAQHVEQARGEQRISILRPLALAYLEAHAIGSALYIGELQGAHLGHAQSCGVGGGEQRASA